MSDSSFEERVELASDTIRKLMIEALYVSSHRDAIYKASKVTCMIEGCHAAIIISMASFAMHDRDKKKAELLLEKAVDMFAVRIGEGLDQMRKSSMLPPDLMEFIPKATKSKEEMKREVDEMIKSYG